MVRACHLTVLSIQGCNKDLNLWKFILEARIESKCPYKA